MIAITLPCLLCHSLLLLLARDERGEVALDWDPRPSSEFALKLLVVIVMLYMCGHCENCNFLRCSRVGLFSLMSDAAHPCDVLVVLQFAACLVALCVFCTAFHCILCGVVW